MNKYIGLQSLDTCLDVEYISLAFVIHPRDNFILVGLSNGKDMNLRCIVLSILSVI